jgi:uncharacterized protein
MRPRDDELSDGKFVGMVATAADCGILFDLHNVWTNGRNGRQSVNDFLAEIPMERVWEVHLAGGSEYLGFWLDSHSGGIPQELYALATRVIPQLPNLKALIFEMAPTAIVQLGLTGVHAELEKLLELWRLRGRGPITGIEKLESLTNVTPAARADSSVTPRVWEDVLGALVVGKDAEGPLSRELVTDPGVSLVRSLVCEFRAGMVVEALQLTSRLLMLSLGDAGFWRQSPPQSFKSTEAETFAHYMEANNVEVPYLPEVLAFERAVIHALIHREGRIVPFSCDPLPLLRALAEGRLPGTITEGRYEVEVNAERGVELSVGGVLFGSASGL